MTLAPILAAPFATQVHILAVAIAVAATLYILPMRKGTAGHRAFGRVWAGAMMAAAISSFWIGNGFSWLHLLTLLVLVNVPYAIWSIRRGNVAAHRATMLSLVFGALGIAGAFALALPGRIMHAALFGG